jgi:hypothetical protein
MRRSATPQSLAWSTLCARSTQLLARSNVCSRRGKRGRKREFKRKLLLGGQLVEEKKKKKEWIDL